jgi:hypothetical protein
VEIRQACQPGGCSTGPMQGANSATRAGQGAQKCLCSKRPSCVWKRTDHSAVRAYRRWHLVACPLNGNRRPACRAPQ